ncbi:hypothetical protein Tco_0059154 [Tanacetum coccineum]
MVKTRSGINNGAEPLKSILKKPRVSADKTRRNVSIESTATVWEVTETNFPTPIKSVWREDESDGHDSFANTPLNAAQQASNDSGINVNSSKADTGSNIHVEGVGQLRNADNTTGNIEVVHAVIEGTDDEHNEKVDE